MKKLLKIALTALMAITMVTVNVSADTVYKVTFHMDNGSNKNTVFVQDADSLDRTLSPNQFNAENLAFIGWSTNAIPDDGKAEVVEFDENASLKSVFAKFEAGTTEVHLYGVWSKTLTLAFHNLNDTDAYKDVNPASNNVVLKSNDFYTTVDLTANTKGFTLEPAYQSAGSTYVNDFAGWYYKSGNSFEALADTNKLTITEDLFNDLTREGSATIDLYAKWTYSIKYVDTLQKDSTTGGPTITIVNYERDSDNSGYVKVDNASPAKTYPLPNGVFTSEGSDAKYFNNPNNNALVGGNYYHFVTWSLNEAGGPNVGTTYNYGDEIVQGHNAGETEGSFARTLFAKYEQFQRVTYENINKAEDVRNPSYVLPSDLSISLNNAVGKNGYTFVKWHKNKGLSDIANSLTNVPVTLYAEWKYFVEYVDTTHSISNDRWNRDQVGDYPTSSPQNRNDDGFERSYKDSTNSYIFNKIGATQKLVGSSTNLVKRGYTLQSWNTQKDGQGKTYGLNSATEIVNGDLYANGAVNINNDGYHELYAVWAPKSYTVTLNDNWGLSHVEMQTTATYDSNITLSSDKLFSRTGYTFTGYYTEAGDSQTTRVFDSEGKLLSVSEWTTPVTNSEGTSYVWSKDSDVKLYAGWNKNIYNVTYVENGGFTVDDDTYDYESETKTLPTPTRTGYDFDGWYTNKDLSGNSVATIPQYSTGDKTFYAKWTPKTFTLTFNKNDGTGGDNSVIVTYDSVIPQIDIPIKPGYTFAGYRSNNNDVSSLYVTANGTSNYVWKTVGGGTGYARWTENDVKVTYDTNIPDNATATSKPQTVAYTYSTSAVHNITLVDNTATTGDYVTNYQLEGWTFKGWSLDENAKPNETGKLITTLDGTTDPLNSEYTVYAIWEQNVSKYRFYPNYPSLYSHNIKHDSSNVNVDSYIEKSVKYDDDHNNTKLPNSSYYSFEGWVLTGWNTKADGSETSFELGQDVWNLYSNNGTHSLYAMWEPLKTVVTFKDAKLDGTQLKDEVLTFTFDSTPTAPIPTKEGYVFAGWKLANASAPNEKELVFNSDGKLAYTNFEGTHHTEKAINKNTVILWTAKEQNLTLVADWKAISYKVVYDRNEPADAETGNRINYSIANDNRVKCEDLTKVNQDFTYDAQEQALNGNVYSLKGWTLTGWNTKADGTGTPYTISQAVKNLASKDQEVVTLYAQWVQNTATISYYANKPVHASNPVKDDSVEVAATELATHKYEQVVVYDKTTADNTKLDASKYTLEGWTQTGWNTQADGKGTQYGLNANIYGKFSSKDEKVNLYATWTENKYKVVYLPGDKPQGASASAIVPVNGKTVAEFDYEDPYYLANKLNDQDTDAYKLTGWHVTKWVDSNDSSKEYATDQRVNKLTPTQWDANGNGVITLVATWEPNEYTVKFINTSVNTQVDGFNATDSNYVQTQKYTYDSVNEISLRKNTFTYVGTDTNQIFNGWRVESGLTPAPTTTPVTYFDGQKVKNLTTVKDGVIVLNTIWDNSKQVIYYFNTSSADGSNKYGNLQVEDNNTVQANPVNITNLNIKKVAVNATADKTGIKHDITAISRVGYTLVGLYKTENFDGASVTNLSQYGNVESYHIYEKWEPIPYKLTLKVDANNLYTVGEGESLEKVAENKDMLFDQEFTVANPTREGFTFTGWYYPNGTLAYDNAYTGENISAHTFAASLDAKHMFAAPNGSITLKNLTVEKGTNVTLIAGWKANTYDVAFDINNPTRDNLTNEDVKGVTDSIVKVGLGDNSTLTKTYNDNSLTVEEYKAQYDQNEVLPTVYRNGYKFLGWSLDETPTSDSVIYEAGYKLNEIGDVALNVTENPFGTTKTVTLYAIWEANTFSITFHANDDTVKTSERVHGSTESHVNVPYDKEITLNANGFSKTGYDFAGWTTKPYLYGEELTVNLDGEKITVTPFKDKSVNTVNDLVKGIDEGCNIDLYAVWTPHTYKVVFDKNDGDNAIKATVTPTDAMKAMTLTFDENYYQDGVKLTANAFKRAGYDFAGWLVTTGALENQSLDDEAKVKNLTTVDKAEVTLKAKWVANNSAVVVENGLTVGLPQPTEENKITAWIDGQPAKVNSDGTVKITADAKVLTVYTFEKSNDAYNDDNAKHIEKPKTMKVYTLTTLADGNKVATELTKFDNIFEYRGTSIRLTGNKGIRIKTGITKSNRDALLNASKGLDGYYALEYGTVMAWADSLNKGDEPTLGYVSVGKAAKGYAYNRAAGYDKVFEWKNDNQTAVFTNVLTGSWTKEQCEKDFAMRPYVILRPVNAVDESTDIVVYGATVYRSIQYVANQALNAKTEDGNYWFYATNSDQYNFFVYSLGGKERTTDNYYGPAKQN